jgi:hypothetical protein
MSYSDKYLQNLWREAVRAHWGRRCARCGDPAIQCHHIVPRRRALLRNDWRNGIALCAECHAWAHTTAGRRWVESQVDMDYLESRDVDAKQWLQDHGMSRAEFGRQIAVELKEKASE